MAEDLDQQIGVLRDVARRYRAQGIAGMGTAGTMDLALMGSLASSRLNALGVLFKFGTKIALVARTSQAVRQT